MGRLIIRNVGCMVSGDLSHPFLHADTIVVDGDRIAVIGGEGDTNLKEADVVIDAQGGTLTPGFIDSHAHPVCGDFQPRLRVLDHIAAALECGLTSFVSAGETHYPGRPRDASGVKALSLLACKSFAAAPPANVRYYAGSVLLEEGLREEDFKELADAGVRCVGEIGISGAQDPARIRPMVSWARQYGMKIMCHAGGPSIPGSANMTAEKILEIRPDIISHVNGGPSALSLDQIRRLVEESTAALEITFVGNLRIARETIQILRERGELRRVIVGTDMPSGSGFVPASTLYVIAFLSAMAAVRPEQAIAMATGNAATTLGIPGGGIRVGGVADLVVMDALVGSAGEDACGAFAVGDIPGVSLVVLRGEVVVCPSRYTPRARRLCVYERGGSKS